MLFLFPLRFGCCQLEWQAWQDLRGNSKDESSITLANTAKAIPNNKG
jgi:hypothetical protein